jgi:hypothetical protein
VVKNVARKCGIGQTKMWNWLVHSLIYHIPQENAELIFNSIMDFPPVKSDILEP